MGQLFASLYIKTQIHILPVLGGILPTKMVEDAEIDPNFDADFLTSKGGGGLVAVIQSMINYLLGLAGAVCLYFIIFGAFDYVGGWKIEQKQGGKNKINYAIGGLVLVSLSWVLVNTLIKVVFKFN